MKSSKQNRWKLATKKAVGTLIFPAVVFLLLSLLCAGKGEPLFATANNLRVFLRTTVAVLCVTFALWINLSSGRFDFSLGSVATLSSLIAALVSIRLELSPVAMFFLAVLVGTLSGLLSGIIYILTNLPPILISLGMTLFFEGLGFAITSGKSVSFGTVSRLLGFNTTLHLIIILVVITVFMVVLFDYTPFGKNHAALISGQGISVATGIREKPNAVVCYAITGALMGVVGVLNAIENPIISINLNFSSVGTMFVGFLPLYIAGFIGKFSSNKLGAILGAAVIGMIKLSYPKLGVEPSTQAIIEAFLLVFFLMYISNEHLWKRIFSFRPAKNRVIS